MKNIVYELDNYEPGPAALKIHEKMLKVILSLRPASVFEVGSGTGLLGKQIVDAGICYAGIEPETTQFHLSREKFPELNIVNASCYDDVEKLGLGKFDVVFSNDVIEHLYLPRYLVRFKKKHLTPGGKVVTCTPDFGNYWKNLVYSLLGRWNEVHSPHWDGGHIKFFSRKSLQRLFEEEGFVNFEWDVVPNLNFPIFPISMVCICTLNDPVKDQVES